MCRCGVGEESGLDSRAGRCKLSEKMDGPPLMLPSIVGVEGVAGREFTMSCVSIKTGMKGRSRTVLGEAVWSGLKSEGDVEEESCREKSLERLSSGSAVMIPS